MRGCHACLSALVFLTNVMPVQAQQPQIRFTLNTRWTDGESLPECTAVLVNLSQGTKTEEPLTDSSQVFFLERGDEYLISLHDMPSGWMADREIWLDSERTDRDVSETVSLHPFDVRIFQHEQDTDIFAPGGRLELRDEKDDPVCSFEPSDDGVLRDEEGNEIFLDAGTVYYLVQTENAQGYGYGQERLIEIPSFMEAGEGPLQFFFPLSRQEDFADQDTEYIPRLIQAYRPAVQADTSMRDEAQETEEETEEETAAVIPAVSYRPSVTWSTHKVPSAEKKTETVRSAPGFKIRMTGPDNKYLSGASLAVYDSQGNPVDAWVSTAEDHLVADDKVKEGETYTVRLLKAAEGYAAASLDIEHTAVSSADGRYPVIVMSDRPKAQAVPQAREEKIKKTADWLVIASCGAAGMAIVLVLAAVMRHSPAK